MLNVTQTVFVSDQDTPTSTTRVVTYTCPANSGAVLRSINVVDTSTQTTDTYVVHLRKNGTAAVSVATQLYPTTTQSALTTTTLSPNVGLSAGDELSVVVGVGSYLNFITTVEEYSIRS